MTTDDWPVLEKRKNVTFSFTILISRIFRIAEEWENLTKVLPDLDFPFYEDNPKAK